MAIAQKISTHKGFQIAITSGMATSIILQSWGEVTLAATLFSYAMNLLWLWEEDVSAIIFRQSQNAEMISD